MYNEKIGVKVPQFLLPDKNVDLNKWSVIACDQFTSQPEYWDKVNKLIKNNPSTLHLIYPEVYLSLNKKGKEQRINNINRTMWKYLHNKTLVLNKEAFILVDRKTKYNESRKGLIITIDLEKYDFSKGSKSLIRSTEQTVIERIPPRLMIRKNAPLELSHTLLLIDDPDRTVIEPIFKKVAILRPLYDFELMMGGGHLKGYIIDKPQDIHTIFQSLERLASPSLIKSKYDVDPKNSGIFLFAVGDGNHSLATAKVHWENIKKDLNKEQRKDHPARFAMVEVINLYDEGLKFEPIHRVVFNVDYKKLLSKAQAEWCKNSDQTKKNRDTQIIHFVTREGDGTIEIKNPGYYLEVASLQIFLDGF
ncbi:MAG: DUF1015 domain-containing protein, partial [Candidatus Hydrogenedentota bacterium]